jgi:hypothetical protein
MSTTLTTRMDHDQNVPRPTSLARITTVPLVVASPDQQDIEMSEVPTLFDADDNLQTFALFLLLEDEVRYKIWALNLPGPRLVVSTLFEVKLLGKSHLSSSTVAQSLLAYETF